MMNENVKDERSISTLTCLTAGWFNWNLHQIEVVSRWRDPQLQVSENYSDLTKLRSTIWKSCWFKSLFIFKMLKNGLLCANKNEKKVNLIMTKIRYDEADIEYNIYPNITDNYSDLQSKNS